MEARLSAPVQTDLGAHAASCTMGTGSFPAVKSGRCVTLTTHALLVLWSRKCRAISTPPTGPTICTESQCLYKCAVYSFYCKVAISFHITVISMNSCNGKNKLVAFPALFCVVDFRLFMLYLMDERFFSRLQNVHTQILEVPVLFILEKYCIQLHLYSITIQLQLCV